MAKVRVQGHDRFEAWFKESKETTLLGAFNTAEEARECCEAIGELN